MVRLSEGRGLSADRIHEAEHRDVAPDPRASDVSATIVNSFAFARLRIANRCH
jgi:hypothetical protein